MAGQSAQNDAQDTSAKASAKKARAKTNADANAQTHASTNNRAKNNADENERGNARNNARNLLVANVTHELRTPIQTILATVDLFNETNLNPEQSEYLSQIHFAAEALLSLVNDFLDFSKLEAGQFRFEYIPYDPLLLAEQTVDLLAIEAFNKGVEIITDIDYALPPLIVGDPTRTRQILLNIIKNAVKFTEKGYVQVKISANNATQTICFEVKDSGIGIPKEKQHLLFTDFFQTDASNTRKFGGTGLGLAISKNFVNMMHGTISMRDNPDGGAIFSFSLPYTLPQNECSVQSLALKPKITNGEKILVVDNQVANAQSLKKKLNLLGYDDVVAVYSGEEALLRLVDAVKTGMPFTQVFIDMIMPNMDGWRLCNEINQNSAINNAKLYLLIPAGQMGTDAKMKRLKWFNNYLYKPIRKAPLVNLLTTEAECCLELECVANATNCTNAKNASTETRGEKFARQSNQLAGTVANAQNLQTTQNAPVFERIADGKTILIAEDHPVNQKLINAFFTSFGAKTLCANNGQEAIELALKHREIDLIFTDIQMPVKNGIDFAKDLRKANITTPIIACTANTDEDDFALYRKAGMNDILIKPFKKQTVYEYLQKWFCTQDTAQNSAQNL